jgi:hypothetical protein
MKWYVLWNQIGCLSLTFGTRQILSSLSTKNYITSAVLLSKQIYHSVKLPLVSVYPLAKSSTTKYSFLNLSMYTNLVLLFFVALTFFLACVIFSLQKYYIYQVLSLSSSIRWIFSKSSLYFEKQFEFTRAIKLLVFFLEIRAYNEII